MSNLESEDLENVPLVRMEDVQPARDRNCEDYEQLETCVVDSVDYGECILENEESHSHIGSMVSIEFEEVIRGADSDSENDETVEVVVPEMLPQNEIPIEIELKTKVENPESWPTLEILPGGVIKHAEKCIDSETPRDCGENMYVCAKCSQSFKYLFCLVKHVKWHETEQKKSDFSKLCQTKQENDKKYTCIHTIRSKVISKPNKRKPKKTKS